MRGARRQPRHMDASAAAPPGSELVVTKSKFDEARKGLEEQIGHVRTPSPRAEPPAPAPARAKTRVVAVAKSGKGAPRSVARAKVVGVKPSLDNQIARFDKLASEMESEMQRQLEDPPIAEGVPPADGAADDGDGEPDMLDSLFAEMSAPSLELRPEPEPESEPEPEQPDSSDEDVELFETPQTSFGDSPLFVTARRDRQQHQQQARQPEPQPEPELQQPPRPPPHLQARPDPQLQPQALPSADPAWVKLGGQVGGLVASGSTSGATAPPHPPPRRTPVSYTILTPAGGDRHVEFSVLLRPADSHHPGLTAQESLLRTLREAGQNVSHEDAALAARYGGAELAERAKQARASPRWIRSNEAKCCMACSKSFGVSVPKHHCRCCGWTVCGGCSKGTLVLERWLEADKPHAIQYRKSAEALRVCDGCLQHGPTVASSVADEFIHGGNAVAAAAAAAAAGGAGGGGGVDSGRSVGLNHSIASAGTGSGYIMAGGSSPPPLPGSDAALRNHGAGGGGGGDYDDYMYDAEAAAAAASGGIWLQFRFSQLSDFHKEINSAAASSSSKSNSNSSSKEIKKMIPKLPSKAALKRRGEAKFEARFLDERAMAVQGYLSQVLALQQVGDDDDGGGGGGIGLGAAVLGHAFRPLLR